MTNKFRVQCTTYVYPKHDGQIDRHIENYRAPDQ